MKYNIKYLIKLYNYESPYFPGKYLKECLVEDYEIIRNEIEVESNKLEVVIKIGNTYYRGLKNVYEYQKLIAHITLKERVKTITEAFVEEITG